MAFKLITCLLFCTPLLAMPGFVEPWGKDSEMARKQTKASKPLPMRKDPLSLAAEGTILLHQNVLTHVDGPRSNFRPTSARYMLLAIRRYGFFKGYIMGCDRLMRENEDQWVYRKRIIQGKEYKWDPTYRPA